MAEKKSNKILSNYNPFLNPLFSYHILKAYLQDVERIFRSSPEQIKKYQNSNLKQTLDYSKKVPVYSKKYKELNINYDEINGIDDIRKLPLISKDDMRDGFPNQIIPSDKKPDDFWEISTSGATGKPFIIFRSTYSLYKDHLASLRMFKIIDIDWRKDKILSIGAFSSQGRYDNASERGIVNRLKPFFPFDNFKSVDYFYQDTEKKIDIIDKFQPDFISSFPGDLQKMATLKKEGLGKNIKPRIIVTSGGTLDKYMREYIEDAFECKICDVYSSIEMGPGAVQCKEGNYHIFSDFINLEFLDKQGEPVASGEPGHVVLTRFFGGGTPIIRYTGLDDIVTPLYEKCPCGLDTPIIKNIEGRSAQQIALPNGTYITPVVFWRLLYKVMRRLNTDKIIQYQVVQENIKRFRFLLVFDQKKKNAPPSNEELFKEIIKEYTGSFGKELEIIFEEVDKVIGADNPSKPPQMVISKLNK